MEKLIVITEERLVELFTSSITKCFFENLSTIQLGNNPTKIQEEFLNRKEVCNLLNCCATSLWKYQRNKLIPYYRIGNKILFKKSEVLDAISSGHLLKKKGGIR